MPDDRPVVFRGGPLSNFAASPIEIADDSGRSRSYLTVEHFFQASKATRDDDHERIRRLDSPRAAKAAGRSVQLRADWEDVKADVMLAGLRAKFAAAPFRERLLASGTRRIIEESRHDTEWGARRTASGWEGQNALGVLLMRVREEMRAAGHDDHTTQLTLPIA